MSLLSPSNNEKSSQPDCSIIIPVFNGHELTRQGLESLLIDQSEHSFEIIVVDNGSNDGVETYLSGLQSMIRLIRNDDNLGFAKANNQAMQQARGRYAVLLNNDTVPQPGWLDAMVETVEAADDIAIVGAKLVYPETDLIQHAGVIFNECKKVLHIYEGFPSDHPAVNYQRDFQVVTAACMLVRTELYRKFGGLDERFINGFEDVDFCLKVSEEGLRTVYQPKAVVVHHLGQSKGRHTHEYANAALLTSRWKDKLRSDSTEKYNEDGYVEIINSGEVNYIMREGVDVKVVLNEARHLYQEGNFGKALEKYEEAYYYAPHHYTTLQYLADIYRLRGDNEKADLALKRSASFAPNVDVTVKLAQTSLKKRDYGKTVEYAQMVVDQVDKHDKRSQEAKTILADAAFIQGDMEQARRYYDEVLYYNPQHVRALTGRGSLFLTENDNRSAHIAFEKALMRNPHHSRAITGKGLACLALDRKGQAVDLILEGLILDPGNYRALAAILPLLTEAGRLEEADEILSNYLGKYPDDSSILFAQAGILFSQQRYDDCGEKLELLKVLAPDLPGVIELYKELEGKRTAESTPFEHSMPA